MQPSAEMLSQEARQYLDIVIESLDVTDDLKTYANFLSEYELSQASSSGTRAIRPPELAENALKIIDAELKKTLVRSRICAAIQRLSGDTWDIAKAVLSSLVALSLSGVITFPQTPFFIALAAIMIARIGTASLCESKA